jgi:hypothetical protein
LFPLSQVLLFNGFVDMACDMQPTPGPDPDSGDYTTTHLIEQYGIHKKEGLLAHKDKLMD